MTYNELERTLITALRDLPETDLVDRVTANAAYATHRSIQNFAETPGQLLSTEVEKLLKGDGLKLYMLALAPASVSGYNVCPHSTAGCRAHCVAYSGNGKYDMVLRARIARTRFLVENPVEFLSLLVALLDKACKDSDIAVRLNGFSDIRWERVLPAWFWKRYASVTFYDYTKHTSLSRPSHTMPANYTLTYSVTERTTPKMFRRELSERNVAVVVETRGGVLRKTGKYRDLPKVTVPTVDGDKNDRRFDDPAGSVVMLRRKGTLPVDSPLVVKNDRLLALTGADRSGILDGVV